MNTFGTTGNSFPGRRPPSTFPRTLSTTLPPCLKAPGATTRHTVRRSSGCNEHTDRLVNSAKIYRMELPYTREQLAQAMVELVRVNSVKHCYLRPVAFRGVGEMGVNPLKNPIEVYILAWAWGKYLGDEALRNGVDVCISSWQRIAPNTLPAMAKASANYMNAQLMKMEALTNGYTEGISLDTTGHVSEGSGENIFVVRDGKIYTPPLSASVLPASRASR